MEGREVRDEGTVCVVAAASAWPFYRAHDAYICQAGRTFRDAGRLAFYSGRRIHEFVPVIEHVEESFATTPEQAARRALSTDPVQRRVGRALAAGLHQGGVSVTGTVVLLSAPDSEETVRIDPVVHEGRAAWTMFQRYVPLARLRAASSTDDLVDEDGGHADE